VESEPRPNINNALSLIIYCSNSVVRDALCGNSIPLIVRLPLASATGSRAVKLLRAMLNHTKIKKSLFFLLGFGKSRATGMIKFIIFLSFSFDAQLRPIIFRSRLLSLGLASKQFLLIHKVL
jgi:hypothetical protein